MSPSAQTLSGRLSAPFSVATDSTRPPRGARHRGHTSATATAAAAAARSRAALALVLLVSAAAFFFVVAARSARGSGGGAAGTDLDASPFSSTSFSSRPSGRTSVGTKSVPASGAEEQEKKKSDKGVEAATTEEEADEASPSPSSKKSSAPPPPPVPPPQPSVFFARSVREFRHDGSAFTQGLEFDRICSGPHALESSGGGGSCRDVFWESTGLNGKSTVRLVDLESGKVLRTAKLPDDAFGEGLTKVPFSSGGEKNSSSSARLLQLTWLSGRAFWHDADALRNSADSNKDAPKNPVEATVGAVDDALDRRTRGGGQGGAVAAAKKSPSSSSSSSSAAAASAALASAATPKKISEETRTPLLDGWGAAFVPAASAIALSDGSSKITFADARNLSRALRTITVTDEGEGRGGGGGGGGGGGDGDEKGKKTRKRVEVFNLNELEWFPASAVRSLLSSSSSSSSSSAAASDETSTKAPPSLFGLGGGGSGGDKKAKRTAGNASLSDGELWANVWGTPCIARIDPLTGSVVGWVLAPDLRPRALAAAASASTPLSSSGSPQEQVDVLNGIAVDGGGAREASEPPLARARLFMTGKNWPLLFEVKLEEAGGAGGAGKSEKSSSSSSSSSEPSSSSSSYSSSQQQQAALAAARASCIRPVADFG